MYDYNALFDEYRLCINYRQTAKEQIPYLSKMSLEITGEEFENIRNIFFDLDGNVDGYVTKKELEEFFKDAPKGLCEFAFRVLQVTENSQIEFLDFLEMYSLLISKKGKSKPQIKRMFRGLDENNDGFLSVAEVSHFCHWFLPDGKVVKEDIPKLVKSLDTNGDGRVEYKEFVENYCNF